MSSFCAASFTERHFDAYQMCVIIQGSKIKQTKNINLGSSHWEVFLEGTCSLILKTYRELTWSFSNYLWKDLILLQIQTYNLKLLQSLTYLTGIFRWLCLHFRNTYFKNISERLLRQPELNRQWKKWIEIKNNYRRF